MKKTYYLAYFKINQDKDFYIELYKGLNYDYALFETLEEAVDAVKKHFKLAIDTFRTSKSYVEWVKTDLEEIYNEPTEWELYEEDKDILLINENLGNYDVEYWIRKVEVD